MKYQTEAEAFRAIAERFATGTNICGCIEDEITRFGAAIPLDIERAVKRRLGGHVGYLRGVEYGWKPDGVNIIRDDEGRALACLWMALEAEEEGK